MDFKVEIASLIAEKAGISQEECASFIEIPPKKEMGDFAFPCFKLARVMRKAPPIRWWQQEFLQSGILRRWI